MRKSPLKKPDQILRFSPLDVVLEQSKIVSKVLLFHPDKIRRDIPRQRCFCNTKSNGQMLLCEACDEWYHFRCIGVTEEEARAADNWQCGYCVGRPDADGNRDWTLAIPQGKRKKAKVAPARNDADTPRARGVQPHGDEVVHQGPSSWADCVALAREGGRKINMTEAKYKKKAMQIVKQGGHHVVDAVTLGGVQARGVDATLVDDLIGQGMLEADEDDEADAADDDDNN